MSKLLTNVTFFLVSCSLLICFISFITIIFELCAQDFRLAWIWVIPFIISILSSMYFFAILLKLDEI